MRPNVEMQFYEHPDNPLPADGSVHVVTTEDGYDLRLGLWPAPGFKIDILQIEELAKAEPEANMVVVPDETSGQEEQESDPAEQDGDVAIAPVPKVDPETSDASESVEENTEGVHSGDEKNSADQNDPDDQIDSSDAIELGELGELGNADSSEEIDKPAVVKVVEPTR